MWFFFSNIWTCSLSITKTNLFTSSILCGFCINCSHMVHTWFIKGKKCLLERLSHTNNERGWGKRLWLKRIALLEEHFVFLSIDRLHLYINPLNLLYLTYQLSVGATHAEKKGLFSCACIVMIGIVVLTAKSPKCHNSHCRLYTETTVVLS